jgi:ADP-ribosyl-[dinitrogen reductase] hydrolase
VTELSKFVKDHVPGNWDEPWRGPGGSKRWIGVRAALTVITQAISTTTLLKRCISSTGEVDTVAAIALAAGTCRADSEQDLTDHLHAKLERGTYCREYLTTLDGELLALARLSAAKRWPSQ